MHPTIDKLIAGGPVVTDGAWGTQLQHAGCRSGDCPDAWNLTHPDKVEEVARSYVEAGSRVILTNTFGANRFILARHGLADKVAEINRAGVEISRRAAGRPGGGLRLGRAERRDADDGPGDRGRLEGRLCRAGRGDRRGRGRRDRDRDDVRRGRGRVWPRPPPTRRACRSWPA